MTETRTIEIRTPGQQIVEAREGKTIRALLEELYVEGLTQGQIADRLGVNRITVVKWTRDLGLTSPRSYRGRMG